MMHYWKKALIFQSLFFCINLGAQTIAIESPRPGSPLEENQTIAIRTTGDLPVRMTLFLNGQPLAERRAPPFKFTISWHTTLRNRIRILAEYSNGITREIRETYAPPKVDFTTETFAFQFFPFPKKPWHGESLTLRSGGIQVALQTVEVADPLPCELTLILDISGSMHFFLEDISEPLKVATQLRSAKGDQVTVLLFDAELRRLALADLWRTDDLRNLFRERAQSSVWDALAGAAMQMGGGPRRVVLLISDGVDDGSIHTAKSVAKLMRQRQAIVCWYNPSNLRNRALRSLVRRTGGAALAGPADKAITQFSTLLGHQLRVVAPNSSYPLDLRWSKGKILYPRWQQ